MNPQAEELNRIISETNPAVHNLLSNKGRNIFFPKKGILGQSADAKGTKIDATIGTAIEDDGSPMRLPALEACINVEPSLIFPYAPSYGRLDIRKQWKEMIYSKNSKLGDKAISLPVVTNALTHGASMAGYLFVNQGDEILVPDLYWGNYNLIFSQAYGAVLKPYKLFEGSALNLDSLKSTLAEGGVGKKMVLLNFPNNPTGYSPTIEEAKKIASVLKEEAEKGSHILVIIDDAYFGLVYEDGIEPESVFTYLSDIHANILALKIDGPTKEDYVWGFRVGFITYGVKGGTPGLYAALEEKTAGAVRGNISNAANISQSLLLKAYKDSEYEQQKIKKFVILKERYKAVKKVLQENVKYNEVFTALPYNSGYFMCVKLAEGIDGEKLRRVLIDKYSIGVINLNNVIRLAFSAVAVKDVPELFEGIYKACLDIR